MKESGPGAPFLRCLFGLALAGAPVRGAEVLPDKSGFTFGNPTPAALLRDLSTDRPDVTESPFTVDAGHVQLELDLVNYSRQRLDGVRTSEWGLAPFNLRLGLRNNLEAGIFVAPFVRRSETAPKAISGIGDVTLRGKYNFWGNDSGETALGLIVDLTLPVAASGLGSDKVEGSLTLPVQLELGGGWGFGAMTRAEFRQREAGGYKGVWSNTATLGRDLGKDVSGYAELTSTAGDGAHVATWDVGLAWRLNANTQLDLGANIGLSRAADDLLVFTGVSRRF